MHDTFPFVQRCSRDIRPAEATRTRPENGIVSAENVAFRNFGVPKGKGGYLPTQLEHLVIPFSGAIKLAA